MQWFQRFEPASLVQGCAIVAGLAGLVTFGLLLSEPATLQANPREAQPDAGLAVSSAPAQWFASRAGQAEIRLAGLFSGEKGAVAILSIDDKPPQAFLRGESLLDGVQLTAIEKDAVVISRAGKQQRLEIARLPEGPVLPNLR